MNKLIRQNILKPVPHPKLSRLPTLRRVSEVFVYSFLSLEYFLSPSGRLRALLRIVLYLTILGLSVLPLAIIAVGITDMLVQIVTNLLVVAFGIIVLVFLFNILTAKPRRRRNR